MLITLGETVLCHGATVAVGAFTGPSDLRLSLQREVQVRQAIDAEEVALAARGNAMWSLSFGAAAEFATPEAALAAAQTLALAIRELGDAPHTLTLGDGATATRWRQAVLTGFDAEPIGCTLRVAYALTATHQGEEA